MVKELPGLALWTSLIVVCTELHAQFTVQSFVKIHVYAENKELRKTKRTLHSGHQVQENYPLIKEMLKKSIAVLLECSVYNTLLLAVY